MSTLEDRQDLVELRGARPEIRQIDQGQGPKEPDGNPALLVDVADQLKGLGVHIECLLLRPPLLALFGGLQQVVERPSRIAGFMPVVGKEPREDAGPFSHRLLDVPRHGPMPIPPFRSRQRAVGHVSNEDVLEGELEVALELAGSNAPDKVPLLERLEYRVDVVEFANNPQHLLPERLADHRRVQEAATNLGWERIDPGGDRGSDRRGQLRLAQALGERTCQLLEEQGVSLGHLHDALDGRGEPLFPKRMRGHCSGVRR